MKQRKKTILHDSELEDIFGILCLNDEKLKTSSDVWLMFVDMASSFSKFCLRLQKGGIVFAGMQ